MAKQVNDEWTVDTLRVYLEALIKEQGAATDSLRTYLQMSISEKERATELRLHSQELAVLKAETAIDKRLEAMNEFRGQLNDLVRTLLPRTEYNVNHSALEYQVDEVKKRVEVTSARLDLLSGKSGGLAQGWTYLIAVITVGIALYAVLKP